MKDNYAKYRNLILQILRDYEMGDAYLVLQGLELIGFRHIDFWFKLVNFVEKYKGIHTLVAYIDVMQEIGRYKLEVFMDDMKIRGLSFKESYVEFAGLLIEYHKYSEEVFKYESKKK